MTDHNNFLIKASRHVTRKDLIQEDFQTARPDRFSMEVYQAFMTGYVKRINESTLKVTIGGVRIGTAKYSRLAQINLKTRIITFSRYAIENVPERGRRYLVLHELAHVKEASHNRRFWEIVGRFESNYKQVSNALQLAFRRNVKEARLNDSPLKLPNPLSGRLEEPKLLLSSRLLGSQHDLALHDSPRQLEIHRDYLLNFAEDHSSEDNGDQSYVCSDEEFDHWSEDGIIHGGSDSDVAAVNSCRSEATYLDV